VVKNLDVVVKNLDVVMGRFGVAVYQQSVMRKTKEKIKEKREKS